MDSIAEILNQSPYNFYFLIVDDFLDIDLFPILKNFHLIYAYSNPKIANLKAKGAPYFCLEEQGSRLPEKNTGRLLADPQVQSYIRTTSDGNKVAIIPFKPSAKIDLICRQNDWTVVANDSSINRILEDKIKFYELCQSQNIPLVPSRIVKLTQDNFTACQQTFGTRLVIQTHFGWAGKSTFTFSSWTEAASKLESGITVKISPFIEGYSLLNNCCLTTSGLLQSPPALQYTGLSGFTTNPFTTVGRQWPSQAPSVIQDQVRSITNDFTLKVLPQFNYKGFFGLDFLVDSKSHVYLLECNPRLTASFAFYTAIELNSHWNPLFFYHILSFIQSEYQFDLPIQAARTYDPSIIGSEITPKDNDSNTIIKYNDFSAFSDTANPVVIKDSIRQKLAQLTHAL